MNLKLLQLGDSALPIGSYSHSWGLEAAIERGAVGDAPALEGWARCWLRHTLAPLEGVVVVTSCRAARCGDWPAVEHANDLLTASLTPPTVRQASSDMGEQLLALSTAWPWTNLDAVAPGRPWHHAVVFGVLAAQAGGDPCDAVTVFLHQAAVGMIGAGVRAVPIGHTHGQQVLARLHEEIGALAEEIQGRDLETAGATCPAYEILCDEQSRLYTRIFRS